MSEWKVCEDCGHRYDQHGQFGHDPAVEVGRAAKWHNGICRQDGCACMSFYTNPENFF